MKLNKLIQRNFYSQPLRRLELLQLTNRVDEINKLFDIIEDDDVLYNLEAELDSIIDILNKSIKATKVKNIGLKLVG